MPPRPPRLPTSASFADPRSLAEGQAQLTPWAPFSQHERHEGNGVPLAELAYRIWAIGIQGRGRSRVRVTEDRRRLLERS